VLALLSACRVREQHHRAEKCSPNDQDNWERRRHWQVMTRAEALKVAQAKAREAQEALDQKAT
jgi:hypothetical protein